MPALDAYETIVQLGRAIIWRKFAQFCRPVVFGGLRKCYPDSSLVLMYPNISSAHMFRYLNDGQFMGTAGALKSMIDETLEDINDGATFLDSLKFRPATEIAARWLTRYMFRHPETIAIDSRGELFFSLEGATTSSLKLERLKVKSELTGMGRWMLRSLVSTHCPESRACLQELHHASCTNRARIVGATGMSRRCFARRGGSSGAMCIRRPVILRAQRSDTPLVRNRGHAVTPDRMSAPLS